MKLRMSQNNCR